MKRTRHQKPGYVLPFFMMVMAIGLLLAIAALSYHNMVIQTTKNFSQRLQATYLAEGGLDLGLTKFMADPNYTGESYAMNGGQVTVNITQGSTANERIVTAAATVAGHQRQYRVKAVTSPNGVAVAFRYGIQVGDLGITMGNSSVINGNVYSNQQINGGNGSRINGDASAVTTIASNITVTGQRRPNAAVQALPSYDPNFWKSRAQTGTIINGNYTPTNNTTIGPLYVTGDLTISNGVSLTIAGPIYVEGRIIFGNGPILTVDSTLDNHGVIMISNGNIDFGNAITVNRAPNGGYLLIVSNSTASNAIRIGNGAEIVNAPLYAPYGTITLQNNAHAVALTARQIITGNGVVIDYDDGLANASFTTGPGGSWVWQKGTYQEL